MKTNISYEKRNKYVMRRGTNINYSLRSISYLLIDIRVSYFFSKLIRREEDGQISVTLEVVSVTFF